jgi:hypothetical protein
VIPIYFFFDGVGTGPFGTAKTNQPVAGLQPYFTVQPDAGGVSGFGGGLPQPHGGSAMGFDGIGSVLISGGGVVGGFGCGHAPVPGFQPAIGSVGRGSPGPQMTSGGAAAAPSDGVIGLSLCA